MSEEMKSMTAALDLFRMEHGRYPTNSLEMAARGSQWARTALADHAGDRYEICSLNGEVSIVIVSKKSVFAPHVVVSNILKTNEIGPLGKSPE
jgi:hypothetical protein